MPRNFYNRHKSNFRWKKRDYDDDRYEDGSGDHLRGLSSGSHRRDQMGGRRSFPSTGSVDMLKRAMAMNLLPTPSGSSSPQNSGLAHGEAWARITVVYGVAHPLNTIQELVNTAFGTQLRFYNACTEGRNAVMYARIRQKQLTPYRKALQTLRDPIENKSLVGDISLVPEPRLPSSSNQAPSNYRDLNSALPEPWMDALRRCFLERYQPTTRTLDLSALHTDPTLLSQGLYLPLNRPAVVHALISILKDNGAQLASLNLSTNRLSHLNAFSLLAAQTDNSPGVTIERIDLSANPLNGIQSLAGLRGIPGLTELDISETPVASRFQENDRSLAAKLVKVLPGIKRLNGEDLPQTVQFAIEQSGQANSSGSVRLPLPEATLGYFPSDDVKLPLLTFLKEYFTHYDSKNRGENLLQHYTSASQLVISVAPDNRLSNVHQNPVSSRYEISSEDGTKTKFCLTTSRFVSVHFQQSRNLLRCRDDTRRREMVAKGSLAIASLLAELPSSEHVLESLTVDVAFHSPTQMLFTMTGVFYEVATSSETQSSGNNSSASKSVRKILRCFSRTMILVAPGGHIVQDDFIIANPSPSLCKKYVVEAATKAQSSGASRPPAPNLGTSGAPQAIQTGVVDAVTQNAMVIAFRERTGMNEAFARQCLMEYAWNMDSAAQAFQALHAAGKLPPEAFA
ncbi:unnamed protein product [Calicophoron daubneyi]|uniref:Nuclear RNA export factor 1 n=1 Tax=Calicophoron daubneyi TaxID=300641 RepID=A0AAV2TG37_CALDB